MRNTGNLALVAATAALMALSACAEPAKVAVFAGLGPRGRGFVSWLQLVKSSPELELLPVDAEMVRAGALGDADVLVMPGGASILEKRDLGPEGVEKIRTFIRDGGGYIGTCAGCSLALEETGDPQRGISLIPYNRIGSKDGFTMPIALNDKGAAALGMDKGEYKVCYHAGPVLVPSTNSVPDANTEVWATYASDFDCPKSDLRMFGKAALVGGTYGKGRLFAIACHPEINVSSLDLVKGAFRYVLGREVDFPMRVRQPRSLVVGVFVTPVCGIETAQALLDIDSVPGVDFLPMSADDILTGQMNRVDYFVLPGGHGKFYETAYKGKVRQIVDQWLASGGKILAWGNGTEVAPAEARRFTSAAEAVEFIRREASSKQSL